MTTPDRDAFIAAVLDKLVAHGPSAIAAAYGKPNACIAAARCARTALARHGIRATPIPVQVDARSATRWVHIGPDSTGPDYSGHLVLDVEGRMLDLTIAQVNRPGLSADPFWTRTLPPDGGTDERLVIEQPGALLAYARITDDSWRQSPNWASPDPYQVTARAAAIALMEQAIR